MVEAETILRKAVETGEILPRINPDDMHNVMAAATGSDESGGLLVRDGKHAEALSLYLAAERTMQIAMRRPERFSFWDGLHKKATDGLLKSLGHMASSGNRAEAQKFCEELRVADTNVKATILDRNAGWLEHGPALANLSVANNC